MADEATDAAIEDFGRRVFALVESRGNVCAWTPQLEFDWVIRVEPRDATGALSFDVLLNAQYLIVQSPRLGWWTFEWSSPADAWQVIEQLVLRGGIVYRRFAWTGASELRDLDDRIVSGPHDNGGLRLRARRVVYPPYS